jgi:hypothetical protein
VTYNDRSVNENMHASLAFQYALQDPGLNIFANFSTEEYELVRGVNGWVGGWGWGGLAGWVVWAHGLTSD